MPLPSLSHLFGGQRHNVLILSHVEVDVAQRVSNHSPTWVAELCVEGLAHAHGRVVIKLYAHVLVVESGQDAVRSPFVTAFVLCLCVVLVLTNGEIQSIGSLIVVGSDGIDSLLLCSIEFEDFCLGSRRNRCGVEAQTTHQRRMLRSHFPRSIVTEVLNHARLCAVVCRQTDCKDKTVAEGADADALLRPVEVGVDGRISLQIPQQDCIRTVCETLVGRSLTEVVVAVEPPDVGGVLRGLHVRGADKQHRLVVVDVVLAVHAVVHLEGDIVRTAGSDAERVGFSVVRECRLGCTCVICRNIVSALEAVVLLGVHAEGGQADHHSQKDCSFHVLVN